MRIFGHEFHFCDRPWDQAPPWAIELREMMGLLMRQEGIDSMATKEHLDALNAQVAANTSAVNSARAALDGYVKTVSDLTAQLQAALANDDDDAVKAAADALAANNATLSASAGATAAAVVANTQAA